MLWTLIVFPSALPTVTTLLSVGYSLPYLASNLLVHVNASAIGEGNVQEIFDALKSRLEFQQQMKRPKGNHHVRLNFLLFKQSIKPFCARPSRMFLVPVPGPADSMNLLRPDRKS